MNTAFPIGISALSVGRRGMDLTGQNIANAATPGYYRQALNLVSLTVGGKQGTGVDVASVTRYTAAPVRTALLRGTADEAAATARLNTQQQVEASLGSGDGTIGTQLEGLFNQVEQLTARPDDVPTRRPLLAAAGQLARTFNTVSADVDKLRNDLRGQITESVDDINKAAQQVADLNVKIANIVGAGGDANDLKDQRDQIISGLSQKIELRTVDQPLGTVNVLGPGGAIVVGETASSFALNTDPAGNLVVSRVGSPIPPAFTSGSLGGQLLAHNQDLPAVRDRLDSLAGEVIRRVNAVQATGLGTTGPLAAATGTTVVADPAAPLNTQNLPFPVQAGNLVISVTNPAGQRTNATVAVDPAAQSLNDVAGAITTATGGNIQVTVDANNRLQFTAAAGYSFDFAGRDTNPPGGGAVANTDTAGVLPALGVNGLFAGTDAASIGVRPELLADPRLLAASRSGQPGDGTNLERFAALRDQVALGGKTLAQESADIAVTVGAAVADLGTQKDAQTGILRTLTAQDQAIGGVDVNEELVRLLDFQRMVEGASKYISVVNEALQSVMDMVR